MLNVVFDTVVFVRCLINPHSFWGKIVFKHALDYRLFVSKQIVIEVLEVLQRPELTKKFSTLKTLDIKSVLDILGKAEVVTIQKIEAVSRDKNDDVFLATAKKAKADYLVTEDRDLLDIKEYQGVTIINTTTFLTILEKKKGK